MIFWLMVLLHLVPVWMWSYLPTQDGPTHLASALILKEVGNPQSHYQNFFEVRREPIPNWSCQVVLASLMHVFPPRACEKILITLYVVCFAGSFRYFLGAFGKPSWGVACSSLLVLFNTCFWMGFYNYCLGWALSWFLLGFVFRRHNGLHVHHAAVLCLLLLLIWFTHLVAFLLVSGILLWLAVTVTPHQGRRILWVLAALIPTTLLTIAYLHKTGFFSTDGTGALTQTLRELELPDQGKMLHHLWLADRHLSATSTGHLPIGLLGVLFVAGLFLLPRSEPGKSRENGRLSCWPLAVLGLGMMVLYFVVPEELGRHGGFLKSRLVLFPPLLFLACGRESSHSGARYFFRAVILVLLALNLASVFEHVSRCNAELKHYVAPAREIGRGQTLAVEGSAPGPRSPNHLTHLADYYCLAGGHVNLRNYQAATHHFPLRFRSGLEQGPDYFADAPHPASVDVILRWRLPSSTPFRVPGFSVVARRGHLEILKRDSLK